MRRTHVMLFDLYAGGHHGQYIQQLATYWGEHGIQGRLDIVVPSFFLEVHTGLPALADRYREAGMRIVPLQEQVPVDTTRPFWLFRTDLEHGRLLRKCISALRPDHCVLMYFDHAQLSLALDLRFDVPVRLSGIYFRPTFHYRDLGAAPSTIKSRLRDLQKTLLLRAALRNPHVANLFCLDPFAVPYIQQLSPAARVVRLPDGIEQGTSTRPAAETRRLLGVEATRKMLLLFGSLARRKGIFELLEAVHRLPEETCRTISLVLAGAVPPAEREPLHRQIASLQSIRPVQVILHDTFVPDDELQNLFCAADLVLLPYQQHVGSSGVLVRAAAEQVPVLGASYGTLGEQIRRHRLGIAVDTASPEAIAQALETYLTHPDHFPFDPDAARQFAEANTAEQMASTIFRHLTTANEQP